jgi:hypothetical protein
LFGRDFRAGQAEEARARLVIDRDMTHQRAIATYKQYLQEIGTA